MKTKQKMPAIAFATLNLSTHTDPPLAAPAEQGLPIKIKSRFDSGQNNSLRFIRLALAGSVLASGMAGAVLLDHGPSDPLLTWPQWYRDTNGLALGLCKSQVTSPNGGAGPMCFPPAPDPNGFVGNVGPEMFYNMVQFKNITTGSDFKYRYVAGVEASYLPLGVPVHGTETVFARVRIGLNFNNPLKNGTYTVTHPFGVEVFNNVKATNTSNVFGNGTAVFFTADVPLAATMNFDLALGGAVGPFIEWDVLQAGESLTVGGTTFLGDPNIIHTFTGSPFGTNYLRIDGPPGSNLDGQGHDFIQDSFANVLGQVWGSPIAQNLSIDGAYKSRSTNPGTNSIDVWATSAANQKLILTGTGMPSLQLFPDGAVPGKYHGHIEYPSSQPVPASVSVANVSSNPIVSRSAVLTDGVEISMATFNTNTGLITVVAHSSDQVVQPELVVQGIPGVPSATVSSILTVAQCPAGVGIAPGDVCFVYPLPASVEPPESISVASADLGAHSDHLVTIIGNPDNAPNPPVASDFVGANGFSVASSGSTVLTNASGNSLPADALIISQPVNGNIAGGIFTPIAGAVAGPDSFQYVRQSANNAPVSNAAIGELTLVFQAQAPVANPDQFAALSANPQVATTLKVLSNDKAATTSPADQLDPASVTIAAAPARGTATKNADGTIGYIATSGGADSFTYTVKNVSGQISNIATVQLTNFTGAESVSIGKADYTISQAKWVVVGSTNWFGANLTQSTATCWTGTAAASTSTTLIGSAPIDTTGKFQISVVGSGPVVTNGQQITCKTSNGGSKVGTVTAK